RHQSFVAAHHRSDIPVAHSLRHFAGQHRTVAAAAVHDHLRVRVGNHLLDVAFQHALAEVNSFGGVAILPFQIFSNIHENGFRIGRKPLTGLVDSNLL